MTSLKEHLDKFLSSSLEIRGGMLTPWVFVGEGYKNAWCEKIIKELKEHFQEKAKDHVEQTSSTKLPKDTRIVPDNILVNLSDVLGFLRGD